MGVYVRPSKRHRFCPHCGKQKMTFASKEAADRFIRYNSDAILAETGFAPTRSYYCESCGCWHVTSSETVHLTKAVRKRLAERKTMHKRLATRAMNVRQKLERAELYLRHAKENLNHGLTHKSEKLFREAFRCLQHTMQSSCCQVMRSQLFNRMTDFYEELSQRTGFKVA